MEEQSILLQAIDSGALDARLSDVCGCGAEGLAHKRARLSACCTITALLSAKRDGSVCFPARAAPSWAATTPTTSTAACWPLQSIWTRSPAPPQRQHDRAHPLDGLSDIDIDLTMLAPQPAEAGTSAALVRGIASRFIFLGYPVRGFNCLHRFRCSRRLGPVLLGGV